MDRRKFIANTSIVGAGLSLSSGKLLGRNKFSYKEKSDLAGFLIPTLVDDSIDSAFSNFNRFDEAYDLVNSSLNLINNKYNSLYKQYYKYKIQPNIGKKNLNGKGFQKDIAIMREKLNDHDKRATTAVHAIRDVKHFDRSTWREYCDIADMQDLGDGSLIITVQDDRPEEYRQEPFFIQKEQAYLVYNPIWYCIGLPIEDPQHIRITPSLGREIKEKVKIEPKVTSFQTQRFYYHGKNCDNLSENLRTIYWGYNGDEAIKKFYNLSPIDPCGDPSENCTDGVDKIVKRGRRGS